MHCIRRGHGKPLLLVHGLGGSWRSWNPVIENLAREREVIAVDLPGHGKTPPLPGKATTLAIADALVEFLTLNELTGTDAVGSSLGARLVLELARRGVLGAVVSLDPGGFWQGWEKVVFYRSLYLSIRLLRLLHRFMPFITRHALTRTLFFSQLSAHPWNLSPQLLLDEMESYVASPSFDELLHDLRYGASQQGVPAGKLQHPMTIGWGRRDRVCFRRQAARALALFPDACLHWFDHSGHFPQWDAPEETARLILSRTNTDCLAEVGVRRHETVR